MFPLKKLAHKGLSCKMVKMGEWHSLGLSSMAMDCTGSAADKLDYIGWNAAIN